MSEQEGPAEAALPAQDGLLLPSVPLARQIEAMLFVSDEGLSEARMAAAAAATVPAVVEALSLLAEGLVARGSGLVLRQLSSGWRLMTAPECAPVLERFVMEGQSGRLSPAALETLAVVAYRQPVSRSRIAAIRGVAVDGVVRTLLTRGLLEEVGAEPSGAILYAVTSLFLDKLGVESVTHLPSLAPLLPDIETFDDIDEQIRSGASEASTSPQTFSAAPGPPLLEPESDITTDSAPHDDDLAEDSP